MIKRLKRVICWLFGHKWTHTMDSKYDSLFLCKRCGEKEYERPTYTLTQVRERQRALRFERALWLYRQDKARL